MKYVSDTKKNLNELSTDEKQILDILRYMKNYQNDLNRGGELIKDYRFSDEREWRYVPEYTQECYMAIPDQFYNQNSHKPQFDAMLKNLRLIFEPNDIKYLIIERDSEISEFLEILRNTKGKKYSYHDIERLMTRILTTEQIVGDI